MSVLNEQGAEINLFSLWAERKVVCAFTRHMGCRFCKEQTALLQQVQEQLRSREVTAIIITIGNATDIPKFREETNFSGEIYVDTQLDKPVCYEMLNLTNGREVLFEEGGENIREETQEAAKRDNKFENGGYGTESSPFNGDILQIGGIFVLGPGNTCDFSYRCSYVGDIVNLTEVVAAATGVEESGEEVVYSSTSKWNESLQTNMKITSAQPPSGDVARSACPFSGRSSTQQTEDASSSMVPSFLAQPILGALLLLSAATFMELLHQPLGIDAEMERALCYTSFALCVAIYFLSSAAPGEDSSVADAGNKSCPFSSIVEQSKETSGRKEVVLHTIRDIDRFILKNGSTATDNNFMSGINMDTVAVAASRGRAFSNVDNNIDEESISPEEQLCSDNIGDSLKPLEALQCYVRDFLAKPNPNLGRKGPTCPFVPTSLKFDSLYLGVVSKSQAPSQDSVEAVVRSMIPRFENLEPRKGDLSNGGKANPKAPYKAIILIFPDIALSDAPQWIDRLQRKLQPMFVADHALMLGEFHKNNNATGLHNDSFYPLRTPFPCLAIRNMVPSDIVFLNCPDYPLPRRISMIQRYLDTFCIAGKKDTKDILKAREMMLNLQQEKSSSD